MNWDYVDGDTSLHARFWSKVRDNPRRYSCWEWTACQSNRDGKYSANFSYGQFYFQGRMIGAHRASYMLNIGPIPARTCVLHVCDNPLCVRPTHLFLGTHTSNMQDMYSKGRRNNVRGAKHSQSKLTDEKVRVIRRSPVSSRVMAKLMGVTHRTIQVIRNRKGWRHVI